ncbi:MAG: FAD-dependent monooxygenase, partial [Pseudomonadota bacterium]
IAVAGGSISGLCAGIALRAAGCDVDVFERSSASLESRGAGILVQPDLIKLLERYNAPPLPMTWSTHRLYLAPGVEEGTLNPWRQPHTSWQAIYKTLHATYPAEFYHKGASVAGFDQTEDGVAVHFEGRDSVDADLLICADGVHSSIRKRLLPDATPRYAGYVAWRGTLLEDEVPEELSALFDDRFAVGSSRSGGHVLNYLIPGDDGSTAVGQRRLNWVWYADVAEGAEISDRLTDREGRRHDLSVGAGMVPDATVDALKAQAERDLHPSFAKLVQATSTPFLQSIVDLIVPKMAFGRACLVGDAAMILRPHAGAASAKAAADAEALAGAIRKTPQDLGTALKRWETGRLDAGRSLSQYSTALGRRRASPY